MWIWVLMPGCAIVLIVMWLILGKDKKTITNITVHPPEDLDPLEMEYAQIATITDRGIFAMLLYWVSTGILQIREQTGRGEKVREGAEHDSMLRDREALDELPRDCEVHDELLRDRKAPDELPHDHVDVDKSPRGGEDRDSGGRDSEEHDGSDDKSRIGVKCIGELDKDAPEHARFLYEGMFKKAKTVWLDRFPPEVTEHKGELRDKVGERFQGKNAVVQDDSMNATMAAIGLLLACFFVIDVMVDVNVWLSVILAGALFCALALLQNGALGFQSKHDTFEVLVGGIGAGVILLVQLILLMTHYGSPLFTVIFGICYLICIPCILFMERRANHRLYGQILGFRQYIETAEWERLKALSEEDPGYGMEILPYAMLFNMGTKWTKQFEDNSIYDCVQTMEQMAED